MTASDTEDRLLPSAGTCRRVVTTWKRIARRFQRNVWEHAPAQLIATEFISLLRCALAPVRFEAALYSGAGERLIASTLPDSIAEIRLPAGAPTLRRHKFFTDGGAAATQWIKVLSAAGITPPPDARHLSGLGQPILVPLNKDGSLYLKLVTSEPISDRRVADLAKDADLGDLLLDRLSSNHRFGGEWASLNRRLTDYLLHEFIDGLETDLAVQLGAEPPEIWLLLMKNEAAETGESASLQFHTSRQKLARVLTHYCKENSADLTVGGLISKIESTDSAKDELGDFHRLLAPCRTNFHEDLDWSDDAPLTIDHLECIAEKFDQGWPAHEGVVGSVVQTGCAEVLRGFAGDYRVEAYEYGGLASRGPEETQDFYGIRLAERVFIKTRPHLVELPILWGVDENSQGRCTAVLLVLFNGDQSEMDPDYFAERALDILNAAEPWHVLFEQHARLQEWNQAIHGHIMHDSRNTIETLASKEATQQDKELAMTRMKALWHAYSFVPDSHRSSRTRTTAQSIIDTIENVTKKALTGRPVTYDLVCEVDPAHTDNAAIETIEGLVEYLLLRFADDSAAHLEQLVAARRISAPEAHISVLATVDGTGTGNQRLIIEISHLVSNSVRGFLEQHGRLIGREIVVTYDTGKEKAKYHRGLYFIGVTLRNSGCEFLRPRIKSNRVIWRFAFPIVQGRLSPILHGTPK